MNWWLPDYQPSDHELEIEGMFPTIDTGARDFPVARTIIICFTNRSGSTFLGEALAATGSVKPAREYLNHPVVRRQSTQRGIESFDAYLIDLAKRFRHRNVFTVKAGLGQLYYLAKLGFLGELIKDPTFLLIERDDTLAQAVSWAIAFQTGQWKSTQESSNTPPEYDFDAIDTRIDAIVTENAAFRAFFARNDCDVEFVRYEQLRSQTAAVIADLAGRLGLESAIFRQDQVEISPQRSTINAEWKARYLDEVRGR